MSKKSRSDSKSSPPQPASLNASLESSAAASIAQTVTERIGELMEEKFLDLRSTLDRLNGRIDDNTRRITESENRISEDEDRITSLENQVSELQQKVKTLTERCDDGENRSRRENIRIIGLKEGSEGQSSVTFFESWLPEVLGMETKRGVIKLDRAHRALGPPKEDRCRPVIIKLHNFTDKQRILTAYIRGSIISYTSAQKKKALKLQLDLEKNIAGLEVQFRQHPSDSLAKQLEAARSALNQLLTKKAQTQIFYAKHRLFESGNKPGRLLARLAKSKMEVNIIPALTDRDGKRQNKSTDINKIMKLYYQDLYSSQCESSADNRADFLDKIKFPTLSDEQKKILNNSISKEEVSEAIFALKGGKAPGPDGFGPEFYKTFCKMLVGPLTDMFVDSFEKGFLPPTLSHAHVSVILKKDKPADLCGSYRPISLISVDSKVLSKLLARRLQNFLPTLVHPDQSGFVPGRLSHSNVRRLLNIIQFSSIRKQKALAVSLDAEKAFDRIEWEYLFDVLHRFGLGGSFLRWIQAIYHSPTASVLTNGRCSEPFALARGVRQGCPLSPLLFALALEPLAETIRMQAEVKGISLGNMEHKIALYADDIILFLTLPKQSIPTTLKAFNKFSSISGYKINLAKSEAMPLGGLSKADVPNDFPFKWTVGGLLYLGVKMSPDLNDMLKLNFSPICTQIKKDLQRWHKLPLSMLGRISLIKMNVLPRLLYPLQMLPLYISKKTNRDLEKAFTNFIWLGKKPRQKLKILQLHPDMGGLSVPNIIFYNWACHAHHYWLWLHTYLKRENCIDSWACSPHSPWGLITCDVAKIPLSVRKNPIIYNGIRVWRDVLKHLGKTKVKSLLSPITQNPDFPADDTVMSFQQLQTTFHVPQKHFFAYLQLRHFISPHVVSTSAVNDVEKFLGDRKDRRHLIGSFYSLLNSLGICLLPDISRKWEIDLDSQYIEDDWQTALRLIKSTFTCNRLRETQYRIIHRLHITPVILHKINRSLSPLCLKCNLERGTYFHCFWECRKISRFWNHISSVISEIFKLKIKKDPGVFLLGLPSRKLQIPTAHYKPLEKLLLIARKCILIQWIKESPPTVTLWYREVFNYSYQSRPSRCQCDCTCGHWSLPGGQWSPPFKPPRHLPLTATQTTLHRHLLRSPTGGAPMGGAHISCSNYVIDTVITSELHIHSALITHCSCSILVYAFFAWFIYFFRGFNVVHLRPQL
uniref:Reverse transcriptase domain-containing protein n=1 Tax=Oryzias latipes TaxID=8090 RepID=A0A3P9JVJ3_ORYLA